MLRRLTLFIMTGLVVLLGAVVEAQALVPLMPQDHPLCREVLQREKRDYVHALYFNKDGYYMSFLHSPDISSTLSLDGRCKGFMDGPMPVSNFQVYRAPNLPHQYYILGAQGFVTAPFREAPDYFEHELYKIDSQTCTPERLHLALPTQTPVLYFMSYAVYNGETYGIYTAHHRKGHPTKDEWMLDYEGQKIIQNLSRDDSKAMVCRH